MIKERQKNAAKYNEETIWPDTPMLQSKAVIKMI